MWRSYCCCSFFQASTITSLLTVFAGPHVTWIRLITLEIPTSGSLCANLDILQWTDVRNLARIIVGASTVVPKQHREREKAKLSNPSPSDVGCASSSIKIMGLVCSTSFARIFLYHWTSCIPSCTPAGISKLFLSYTLPSPLQYMTFAGNGLSLRHCMWTNCNGLHLEDVLLLFLTCPLPLRVLHVTAPFLYLSLFHSRYKLLQVVLL